MATFTTGAAVQYHSTSHGAWLDTLVEDSRANGEVQIACKPGYWMPLDEQKLKLRAVPSTPVSGGYPKADAKPGKQPAWAADQAIAYGQHGPQDARWAPLLDQSTVKSVHAAVDKLNEGTIACPGDFCLVYSASSQSYFILYQRGHRETVVERMLEQFRDSMASKAKLQEQLAKASGKLQAKEDVEVKLASVEECLKDKEVLEAKVASLEESLQEKGVLQAKLEKAQEKIHSLEAATDAGKEVQLRAAEDRQKVDELAAKLVSAEQETARIRVLYMSEQENCKQANQQCEALRKELSDAKGKLNSKDDLQDFLAAAEKELSLQKVLDEERDRRKQLQDNLKLETEAQQELRKELQEALKTIDTLQQEAARNKLLADNFVEHEKEVCTLKATEETLRAQIADLKLNLASAEAAQAAAEAKLKDHQAMQNLEQNEPVDNLKSQLDAQTKKGEELEKMLANLSVSPKNGETSSCSPDTEYPTK